ncbi:hypothetical protein ICE98_03628 [Lactococcus lactis]|nr:hypothetical protein [Lactococcus lactis]
MKDCPFCQMKDTIFENELAQAFYDAYPVSEGHMLITPKRHVSSYFEMTKAERKAIEELLELSKSHLDENFMQMPTILALMLVKQLDKLFFIVMFI